MTSYTGKRSKYKLVSLDYVCILNKWLYDNSSSIGIDEFSNLINYNSNPLSSSNGKLTSDLSAAANNVHINQRRTERTDQATIVRHQLLRALERDKVHTAKQYDVFLLS